jgi:hypothetical protein
LRTIRQNFPTLSLEQIHGAIAFCLGHQEEADAYLRALEKKWEEPERAAKPASPAHQGRIEKLRKRLLAKQAALPDSLMTGQSRVGDWGQF